MSSRESRWLRPRRLSGFTVCPRQSRKNAKGKGFYSTCLRYQTEANNQRTQRGVQSTLRRAGSRRRTPWRPDACRPASESSSELSTGDMRPAVRVLRTVVTSNKPLARGPRYPSNSTGAALFESAVKSRICRTLRISSTNHASHVPKVGLHHGDGVPPAWRRHPSIIPT